jgi:hypothetical protein
MEACRTSFFLAYGCFRPLAGLKDRLSARLGKPVAARTQSQIPISIAVVVIVAMMPVAPVVTVALVTVVVVAVASSVTRIPVAI